MAHPPPHLAPIFKDLPGGQVLGPTYRLHAPAARFRAAAEGEPPQPAPPGAGRAGDDAAASPASSAHEDLIEADPLRVGGRRRAT